MRTVFDPGELTLIGDPLKRSRVALAALVLMGMVTACAPEAGESAGQDAAQSRDVTQPIPGVTEADVQRVLQREFVVDDVARASLLLEGYEAPNGGAASRVRLAILKLAGGDLDRLGPLVDAANRDFRDVIGPAEYGSYGALPFDATEAAKRTAIAEDSAQYHEWLIAPGS